MKTDRVLMLFIGVIVVLLLLSCIGYMTGAFGGKTATPTPIPSATTTATPTAQPTDAQTAQPTANPATIQAPTATPTATPTAAPTHHYSGPGDYIINPNPNYVSPTATATPTATPTPTPTATPTPTDTPADTLTLTGTIYHNAANGGGVYANVYVSLYDYANHYAEYTVTNSQGHYAFSGLTIDEGESLGYYIYAQPNSGDDKQHTIGWTWYATPGGAGTFTVPDITCNA